MIIEKINGRYLEFNDDARVGDLVIEARVSQKSGSNEKAQKLYQRALEICEKSRKIDIAALIAKEAGMIEKAKKLCYEYIEICGKIGMDDSAALIAHEVGFTSVARYFASKAIRSYKSLFSRRHKNSGGKLSWIDDASIATVNYELINRTSEIYKALKDLVQN